MDADRARTCSERGAVDGEGGPGLEEVCKIARRRRKINWRSFWPPSWRVEEEGEEGVEESDEEEEEDGWRGRSSSSLDLSVMESMDSVAMSLMELEMLRRMEEEQIGGRAREPGEGRKEEEEKKRKPRIIRINNAKEFLSKHQNQNQNQNQAKKTAGRIQLEKQLETLRMGPSSFASMNNAPVVGVYNPAANVRMNMFKHFNPPTMAMDEFVDQEIKAGRMPAVPHGSGVRRRGEGQFVSARGRRRRRRRRRRRTIWRR